MQRLVPVSCSSDLSVNAHYHEKSGLLVGHQSRSGMGDTFPLPPKKREKSKKGEQHINKVTKNVSNVWGMHNKQCNIRLFIIGTWCGPWLPRQSVQFVFRTCIHGWRCGWGCEGWVMSPSVLSQSIDGPPISCTKKDGLTCPRIAKKCAKKHLGKSLAGLGSLFGTIYNR